MNLVDQRPTESKPIARSTAFRLPLTLLEAVDQWCNANDMTRSQFFRHSIIDRVKSLGLDHVEEEPKEEEEAKWAPNICKILERRH